MARLREYILTCLQDAKGDWVSGEHLRQLHDVSRMAISKQVKALLHLGYEIESSTRKGYRLTFSPDLLLPETVIPTLPGPLFTAETYHYHDETRSTNDDAKQLALHGAPHGTVITAEAQKRGRGRRGRIWFGQRGNSLLTSIVLRPNLPPTQWTLLPLMTAVAIHDTLELCEVPDAAIKWPNDVLVNGKKIAGILCELGTEVDRIEYAIIGIGLNVNTPSDTFPADVRDLACSMYTVTGHKFRRAEVLTILLNRLQTRYEQSCLDGFRATRERWLEKTCTIGESVCIDTGNGVLKGIAVHLTESGALILRDAEGNHHTVHSGDLLTV